MTTSAQAIVPEINLVPPNTRSSPMRLHCLSLYTHAGSKALLLPDDPSVWKQLRKDSPDLQNAKVEQRQGSIRIRFPSGVWNDRGDNPVRSRKIMLDMIRKHRFLCCADLNRREGKSAGNLFFDSTRCNDQVACLTLSNQDKIRIIELPSDELPDLQAAAERRWELRHASRKYGVDEFKFAGTPWVCEETSNAKGIRSRRLVMALLQQMYTQGWTRVVSAKVDTDSMVFFRSNKHRLPVATEMCCIILEQGHKMRIVGEIPLDGGTMDAFSAAASQSGQYRIREQIDIAGTRQIKFDGQPWMVHSTQDALRAARMFCCVLEAMFRTGWEWHCAVNLSATTTDKSSFFFRRGSARHVQVVCIQPKGDRKINFVGFPPPVLQRLVQALQTSWIPRGVSTKTVGGDVVLQFPNRQMFEAQHTNDKIRTMSFFRGLLEHVLRERDAHFLGTADISGQTHHPDNDSAPKPLDTDVFFFAFWSDLRLNAASRQVEYCV